MEWNRRNKLVEKMNWKWNFIWKNSFILKESKRERCQQRKMNSVFVSKELTKQSLADFNFLMILLFTAVGLNEWLRNIQQKFIKFHLFTATEIPQYSAWSAHSDCYISIFSLFIFSSSSNIGVHFDAFPSPFSPLSLFRSLMHFVWIFVLLFCCFFFLLYILFTFGSIVCFGICVENWWSLTNCFDSQSFKKVHRNSLTWWFFDTDLMIFRSVLLLLLVVLQSSFFLFPSPFSVSFVHLSVRLLCDNQFTVLKYSHC